jgi:hypothetical protein
MTKRTNTSKTALGIVAAIVAVAGLWGLDRWKPLGFDWPDEWESRVAPLASYVERHTGFDFKNPVPVRFLGDKDFNELVTENEEDLTDEDKEYYDNIGALLRALGLASGNVDIFEDQNSLNKGRILAYYSPKDREMVIRADKKTLEGAALSPALRAVVVHELTHALQDQVFGLAKIRNKAKDSGHGEALTTLIEGHALGIESAYANDNFSDAEREQYGSVTQADDDADVADIPQILSAQQMAPYVFGPTFVKAIEREKGFKLEDAFLKKQPTSLEQVILPSKYFAVDKPEDLDAPKTPKGAKYILDDQINQLDLYFLLTRTLGAPLALKYSDTWGNGRYVVYSRDKVICSTIHLRGETDKDTEQLAAAFTKWAQRDTLKNAKVKLHEDHVVVDACDPGTSVRHDLPTEDDTSQIFWRAGDIVYIWQSEAGVDAECAATGLYTEFTTEELVSNDAVVMRYNELLSECALD